MKFDMKSCCRAFALLSFSLPCLAQDEEEPAVAVAVAAEAAEPSSSGLRPLLVTIDLSNTQKLKGTLLETTQLDMKTSFGSAAIPLNEVAGIKMAQEGNATTTVILHNGDSITGAADFTSLVLQTEWGKAEINMPHVTSVLFSEGLKWESSKGLNGTRWRLVEAPAAASRATAANDEAGNDRQAVTRANFNQPALNQSVPRRTFIVR